MNPGVASVTTPSPAPSWPVLQAPARWQTVDFISDLHLQAGDTATFLAWQEFMHHTPADAVFILGDLFEVWVGDDVIIADPAGGFEACCAQILHSAAQRLDIFFMHGNRDFLLGPAFADACRMTLLDDPTVLAFAGQRWLLSHGDMLCLADAHYQQFRQQVRNANWQQTFLSKPLAERQVIARSLRTQSETRKRSGVIYADVDAPAACDWLATAHASTLIHGHTHQPADHNLPGSPAKKLKRVALSDWDLTAKPPRAEVLRLTACVSNLAAGYELQRLPVTQARGHGA